MTKHIHLFLFTVIFFFIWTLLIVFSSYIAISTEKQKTVELAKKEAITTVNNDQSFRFWAAEHGGVYVPISEKTPPNKYLNHILNRDITTPSGQKLTLMNPAYMIRQVMEYYGKLYGTTGFITSLKVLNPLNKPDDWQRNALKMLEKRGEKEIVGIIQISGETYLKLMRPIFTNEGCLKCHGFQGYQVGDLRGGVGVTVAMAPYLLSEKQTIKNIIKLHLFFWSFGVLFLILFTFWGSGRLTKEKISKKQLQLSNQQLHRALEEINTLRGIIPICSYCKKIRDEEGVWNQLEAYIHSRSEAEFSHGICPECYIREIKEIG